MKMNCDVKYAQLAIEILIRYHTEALVHMKDSPKINIRSRDERFKDLFKEDYDAIFMFM